MMNKRAQLSIETMIIYGLIILVALSVIGGLLYFNVLDLGSYLPDKCDLGGTGDLKCEEMKFTSTDGLELGIRNIGQKPISLLEVYVEDKSKVQFSGEESAIAEIPNTSPIKYVDPSNANPAALAPGEIAMVKITAAKASMPGKLLRGTLRTEYKFAEGAITQESTGSIRVKAGS